MAQRGLSLLEVLVVIAIVAALLAALTLSFGGSASRRLENRARRAQALIELACDRASLSGSDMGIRVGESQLEFGFIDAVGWHPVAGADSGDPLRPRSLGDAVTVRLQRDGRELRLGDVAAGPQLACLGSGELTPFVLEFRSDDSDDAWRLRGDALRRLTLERIDASR
ncbi:MAG: GspH/FimT family pseudopilin [Xanthomonadales bacterium]|nr:GspH/FimT family pseudopilin [Xanthomonadales bacterium]